MDVFVGFITPFPWAWAPYGWSLCNGAEMAINQYTALYSLLGINFGGNGTTTFKLPNLQGRQIMGVGPGTAGGYYEIGNAGGHESVTLNAAQAPVGQHTHTATMSPSGLTATTNVSVSTGTTGGALVAAAGSTLTSTAGGSPAAAAIYLPAATQPTNPVNLGGITTTLGGSGAVTVNPNSGGSASSPVDLRNPYLALNFCIALNGLYPSRN
ncbi:MAG: phage tail protein [Rhodocyclaceae bacterium]|nr:phage tail protein [Rhodocyclaceae bacterium]